MSETVNGWTILSGLGYGQPTWIEAKRGDAYIIVDSSDWAVMENGLIDEFGQTVPLPAAVRNAILTLGVAR